MPAIHSNHRIRELLSQCLRIALALTGACAMTTQAQWRATDGSIETREHFEVKDERSAIHYRLTKIVHLAATEDRDTTLVLIEDAVTKDRLTVTDTSDYLKHVHSCEVRLLDTNETLTVSYPTPWKSLTRSGAIAEFHALGDPAHAPPAHLTININGVDETAAESEWNSPATAQKKSNLWRAASSRFLDALHRLRAIGTQDQPLPTLCAGVLAPALYDGACLAGPAVTPVAPDCAFDASFRYNCSHKSIERARDATTTGAHIY